MASSFAAMRAKRKTSDLEAIQAKIKTAKSGGGARDEFADDDTFWTLKHIVGTDGKGSARIRFLPATEGEDDPYVKWQEYAFKGKTGKWYINKSRMSLGRNESDPAYEYNGKIFGDKSLTKEQRQKKLLNRNEHTIANILIISDKAAPEYEGQVKKFKFGPQIWNMIDAALFPEFDDQKPINVFDPFEGADFVIRVKQKKIPNRNGDGTVSVPTYEDSSFDAVSALVDDEDDFDEIWARQYPLKDIVSEDKFKSYEQLVKEFNAAMYDTKGDDEERDELPSEEPRTRTSRSRNSDAGELDQKTERATARPKTRRPEPEPDPVEEIDDEIPFDEGKKVETKKASVVDDDEDWFSSLKKPK